MKIERFSMCIFPTFSFYLAFLTNQTLKQLRSVDVLNVKNLKEEHLRCIFRFNLSR